MPAIIVKGLPVGDYLLIVWLRRLAEDSQRFSIVLRVHHIPTSCTVAEVDTLCDMGPGLAPNSVHVRRLENGTVAVFCGRAGLVCVKNAFQN